MNTHDDWYAAWCDRYIHTFGLASTPHEGQSSSRTLLAWRNALWGTEAELYAALDWLVSHPEIFSSRSSMAGKWVTHLAALQTALRQIRAIEQRQTEDQDDDGLGTCTRCGGTGRVIVPHLSCVQCGRWVPRVIVSSGEACYYTCAVWCACPLGCYHEQRCQEPPMMRIERYQSLNPRWRDQLQERHGLEMEAAYQTLRLEPDATRSAAALTRALVKSWGMT